MSCWDPAASHAALARDLHDRVFALGAAAARPRRVGAEVELIAIESGSRRVARLDGGAPGSLLHVVRRHAARAGWAEQPVLGGPPRFRVPGGGLIGFEPGGQLEYSTPAFASATELLASLCAVIDPLRAAAADAGIELLGVGIDPYNSVDSVPLQVATERYARMATYLARRSPAGARMMRQTAAVQVSLDFEGEALARWRLLNAAAPYVTAIFANSPVYLGAPTGWQSWRAQAWRELDPARTGIFLAREDPVAEYLDFALAAPALLMSDDGATHPFRALVDEGRATREDWDAHLSTLFPEVRPRGYLEVRGADAIEPEWYAAPVALLCGICYDAASARAAADLLSAPQPELLAPAAQRGLHDRLLSRTARDLFEIALAGCAALGAAFFAPAELERARAFFERYTRHGRTPADDRLAELSNPAQAMAWSATAGSIPAQLP